MADEMGQFFASLLDEIGLTPDERSVLEEQYESSDFPGKLSLVNELQALQKRAAEAAGAGPDADGAGLSADGGGSDDDGVDEGVNLPAVDAAWRNLLEETLPKEKRDLLQQSYDSEPSALRKYHMLLEFSSYLRKPEATDAEDSRQGGSGGLRRRGQGSSRMGGYDDMRRDDEEEDKYGRRRRGADGAEQPLWPLLLRALLVVACVVAAVWWAANAMVPGSDGWGAYDE